MTVTASTKTGRAEKGQQSIGRRTVPHQATIGLLLAGGIMTSWIGLHAYGVYLHHWSGWSIVIAPAVIAAQTWLSVGLFIVAHDAMHGSLAPGRPGVNTTMGVLALGLYAGFRFHRLREAHGRHHAAPGTADDRTSMLPPRTASFLGSSPSSGPTSDGASSLFSPSRSGSPSSS